MTSDWARAALRALDRQEDAALVSILAIAGSAPREAGVRMLVTREELAGTIGGGNLEMQALRQARLALDHPKGSWRVQDYPLGPFLQQCCGGKVRLLIEHLDPRQRNWIEALAEPGRHDFTTRFLADHLERDLSVTPEALPASAKDAAPAAGTVIRESSGIALEPLFMAGAGHVGIAIAKILEGLPFSVDWRDTRQEMASASGAKLASAEEMVEMAGSSTGLVLILTHDHALDYDLTKAALQGKARFVGVIGSATKSARFRSRLAKDGVDDVRFHCPIGLIGISGKQPEVIAVSVAAQLLQLPR